jgi:predicted Zn-dependent peptidase
MYDDNSDWRLYFGTIANMYHQHPVKIDIAGTVESIAGITKDMLYECYNTFYHPSNMLLFVVGPVDVESTMKLIRDNQNDKGYNEQPAVERKFDEEPEIVAKDKEVLRMNVQTPKVMLGIKAINVNQSGLQLLKRELATNIYLEMLFGKSSPLHEELYEEGLIDQSFSYDYTQEQGFGFALIGGDSAKPDELMESLFGILQKSKAGTGLNEESLQRTIKKKIGSFLRSLNSPEYIANQFTRYAFNDMNLFDVVSVLEKLTIEDIREVAKDLISDKRMTVCQVLPK